MPESYEGYKSFSSIREAEVMAVPGARRHELPDSRQN